MEKVVVPRKADAAHRHSRRYHAAAAQFHRWFQFYERPRTPEMLARQLTLLDPEIRVESVGGRSAVGHEEYHAGVSQLPEDVRNAHHVRSVALDTAEGDLLRLNAEVVYQGLYPNGAVTTLHLNYDTELHWELDGCPLFTRISIHPVGSPEKGGNFADAYPSNRVAGFVHRWLYLVEDTGPGMTGFDELLGPDDEFDLGFSSKPIHNRAELAKWRTASPHRSPRAATALRCLAGAGIRTIVPLDPVT